MAYKDETMSHLNEAIAGYIDLRLFARSMLEELERHREDVFNIEYFESEGRRFGLCAYDGEQEIG